MVNARSLIILFVCLQGAGIVVSMLVAEGVFPSDVISSETSLSDVQSHFSLNTFTTSVVAGGIVGAIIGGLAGLIGLITRQGIYALYAAVIWLVGIMFGIANWVVTGYANVFQILLPVEWNTGGVWSGVIGAGILVVFFLWLAGIVGQRPDF